MSTHKMKLLALAISLSLGLVACEKNDADKMNDGDTMGDVTDGTGTNSATSGDVGDTNTGLDDAGITAKVKAALIAEPDLSGLQINVDTSGGVVTLSGNVDSDMKSQRAQQLASNAAGVVEVKNNLIVEAPN